MVVIHTAVFAYSIAVTMVAFSCFIDKKPAAENVALIELLSGPLFTLSPTPLFTDSTSDVDVGQ